MRGMILAAGFGTRFRPVTHDLPKPMIPLCNRPLIGWALEPLLAAGIDDVVVNLHHLPEAIERHLVGHYGDRCRFHFSREAKILGTGGGVRQARRYLEEDEEFALVNGDTVQWPPYREMIEARRRNDALAALLLRHAPSDDRFTPVWREGEVVSGIGEGRGEAMMFAGAHVVSRRIFSRLPDREFSSITGDVYVPLLAAGEERIAAVVHDGPWFDIGTPLRYLAAASAMLAAIVEGRIDVPEGSGRSAGSLVSASARVEGSLEASVVGDESVVEEGARLDGAHVWHRASIGRGATIRGSIIAGEVRVAESKVVENVLVSMHGGERVVAAIDPGRPSRFD